MGNTVCCGDASQQNVLQNGIRKELIPKKNKDPFIENFQQDDTEDTGDQMTLDNSSVSGIQFSNFKVNDTESYQASADTNLSPNHEDRQALLALY